MRMETETRRETSGRGAVCVAPVFGRAGNEPFRRPVSGPLDRPGSHSHGSTDVPTGVRGAAALPAGHADPTRTDDVPCPPFGTVLAGAVIGPGSR